MLKDKVAVVTGAGRVSGEPLQRHLQDMAQR